MATLVINNANEFDMNVWTCETDFSSEKYKEWLDCQVENIKTLMNDFDDGMCDCPNNVDGDMIGDLINMLESIDVDADRTHPNAFVTRQYFEPQDIVWTVINDEIVERKIISMRSEHRNDSKTGYQRDTKTICVLTGGIERDQEKCFHSANDLIDALRDKYC